MMRLIGEDCGPPRLPLKPMSDAELRELASRVRGIAGLSRPVQL
jgi:hypothetical protein